MSKNIEIARDLCAVMVTHDNLWTVAVLACSGITLDCGVLKIRCVSECSVQSFHMILKISISVFIHY